MTTAGCDDGKTIDLDVFEETALAMAQAEIQNALNESSLRRTDLALRLGKPRSFVSKILGGSHNLTIRTMARVFAACGYELRFSRVPAKVEWEHTTIRERLGPDRVVQIRGLPPSAADSVSAPFIEEDFEFAA
jgi:hypothetical protein